MAFLHQIRSDSKGKRDRLIIYPLSKGEGAALARVDFKWKRVDLFNKTVKFVQTCNNEILRRIREKETIEKFSPKKIFLFTTKCEARHKFIKYKF